MNYPTPKLCIHFVYKKMYKMYATDVYKIFRPTFVYILYTKSKELCQLNFCIQNIYNCLSKCGIHFVYKHFVYILYTKVCWNVGYILYKHLVYILYTSVLIYRKCTSKHYVSNLYTKFVQNVYANNCMQNGCLISTYFDLFVVHFLVNHCEHLKTWNLLVNHGRYYQINGLMDYILH